MKTHRTALLGLFLFFTSFMFAQNHKIVVDLWPNGAPNNNELTGEEKMIGTECIGNISNASMTVYPSSKPNSKAIIMCPGGAYICEAFKHEGHDMADWMNSIDITYIVLKYRLPNGHYDVPISDVHQAFILAREHCKEWNINPNKVGIMGASAGGHLAATGANMFTKETRPDFQILLYPVITMDKSYTHQGSRECLLGKNPSDSLVKKYSMEKQVTDKTPRAFIVLCSDDDVVTPANSLNYCQSLINHKVPVSIHAYPKGGHGFGFRDSFQFKRQWTEELEKWLTTF